MGNEIFICAFDTKQNLLLTTFRTSMLRDLMGPRINCICVIIMYINARRYSDPNDGEVGETQDPV